MIGLDSPCAISGTLVQNVVQTVFQGFECLSCPGAFMVPPNAKKPENTLCLNNFERNNESYYRTI